MSTERSEVLVSKTSTRPITAVETYGYFLGSMWVKINEDKFVLKIEWLRVLLYNEEKSKLKMREYMLKPILRFVFCDK